jgi:serine/threonine protein kinase
MDDEERHVKAKGIFLRAVEADERDRAAYLAAACSGDEGLRQEVLLLLADDAEATGKWEDDMRTQVASQLNPLDATVVSPWPIGEVFGERYFIQQELGRGGIGAIYLATDAHVHSRAVVVKLLLDTSSQNQYLVNKFKHEGEGLSRIKHPGVVSVIDLGETRDKKPYLVMEFVEGKVLSQEIQPGGMDFQRAAVFIRQIAQALTAAHFEGIVHRDLKPANVMIQHLSDNSEQAKLIDFGIAKLANPQSADATLTPVTMGSPAYMSPEQLERRDVTPRSDIFALGVVTFEMLTGARPFAVDTSSPLWTSELVTQQRAGISREKLQALRADLPGAAQREILRALSYAPADRPQQAFEFGEGLYRALTNRSDIELAKIDLTSLALDVSTHPSSLSFDTRGLGAKPSNRAVESFERLWSNSIFTDRIRPLSLKDAKEERTKLKRGLGAKPKRAQYGYRLGDELCLAFDIQRNGYLTLLDEGPEGIIYCLCPSQFAPSTRLESGRVYLPQVGSPYQAFELSGAAGKEKLLAIISDEPLGLDWLSNDTETPARVLSGDDIESLFRRLQVLDGGCWTALASYLEVVS